MWNCGGFKSSFCCFRICLKNTRRQSSQLLPTFTNNLILLRFENLLKYYCIIEKISILSAWYNCRIVKNQLTVPKFKKHDHSKNVQQIIPPGAASAHARVFIDFSKKKIFQNFSIFRGPGPLRARPPGAASAHAREFFQLFGNFFFSKLFFSRGPGPARTSPGARYVRMREYFSTIRKKNFFQNFSILRGPGPAHTTPLAPLCAHARDATNWWIWIFITFYDAYII